MARKKVLIQTNSPFLKSGLGENGRYLMRHLLKTGKYDVTYYCTQTMQHDPNLNRLPCKAFGAIPADQNLLNQLNQDPGRARDVAYGSFFIDQIIKDVKPSIWWESDDLWSTNGYLDKPWFNKIHTVFHKTPDSRPILDDAFKQAKATPNYTTWSEFAAKEMRRVDPSLSHVRHIYGMFDTTHFSPIPPQAKADLRKRFGIDKNALIFHTTNRNQLRKCFVQEVEAFAAFKRENPNVKAKLHFHTSFSEKAQGWDIPKMAAFNGLKSDDILCTYICRSCGNWHVAPYQGEDVKCPFCGAEKAMITPNIGCGVPDEEMRLMHGLFDAGISAFDSGGLERFSVASMLCGLPTAISSYSCGEDFMDLPFVHPIAWTPYYQPGTNFMKATPNVNSLKGFMNSVARMSESKKQEIGEKSRDWTAKTFSIDTIGAQWESLFDSLPPKDWSSITLDYKPKNDKLPIPVIESNEEWVKSLYNQILLVEPDPEGFKYWLSLLERGVARDQIYNFFISRAREDNAKNAPSQDFSTLFDSNGRKRALFVLKESGGDLFVSTALFKGLTELYPEADLYVACDPKFSEVLAGNPYIHKVLPYHLIMEQELAMMRYVDYYYFPALATQRQLNYLTHDKIALTIS